MPVWMLALAAMADTDEPCPEIRLTSTVPSANAEGVPTDARVVAIFEGYCRNSGERWRLQVVDAADGSVLATQDITVDDAPGAAIAALAPDATWPADRDLVFRAISPVFSFDSLELADSLEIPFTTGSGAVQGVWGAPGGTLGPVAVNGWGRATASFEVAPATDLDGLTLVQVDAHGTITFATRATTLNLAWSQKNEVNPLCVEVVQIDGLGRTGERWRCALQRRMPNLSGRRAVVAAPLVRCACQECGAPCSCCSNVPRGTRADHGAEMLILTSALSIVDTDRTVQVAQIDSRTSLDVERGTFVPPEG